MYDDAHRLTGDRNMIGVDIRQTLGKTVRIVHVFDGLRRPKWPALRSEMFLKLSNGTPIHSMGNLGATLKSVPFSSTAVIRVIRNGSVQEKNVVIGIPSNLPELSAAANRPFPGAEAGVIFSNSK